MMNENTEAYCKIKDDKECLDSGTEDLSEDQWRLILWSLLTDVPVKEWNEFVYDLALNECKSSTTSI